MRSPGFERQTGTRSAAAQTDVAGLLRPVLDHRGPALPARTHPSPSPVARPLLSGLPYPETGWSRQAGCGHLDGRSGLIEVVVVIVMVLVVVLLWVGWWW